MKKLFLASLLAVASLAVLPNASRASGNEPYSSHGYGWLGGIAFRHMQWIHSNGPLYNYGPYIPGPGYTQMHIPQPYYGSYVPANYGLYNNGGFQQGYPQGYPQGQFPTAPQQVPAAAQPIPPAQPPVLNAPTTQSRFRLFDRSKVVPASYSPIYPNWLTGR